MTLLPAAKAEARVTFDLDSNVLWIDGSTSTESWRRIKEVLDENKPKYIMMEGPGGDFYAGLAIGNLIKGYHVVITGRCVSSCAISAMSASEVSFLNEAALLFHGPFITSVPITVTLEEYSSFIVGGWIDLVVYMNKNGVSTSFVRFLSTNTSTCKLAVVQTQEELDMLKEDQYPNLTYADFCQK